MEETGRSALDLAAEIGGQDCGMGNVSQTHLNLPGDDAPGSVWVTHILQVLKFLATCFPRLCQSKIEAESAVLGSFSPSRYLRQNLRGWKNLILPQRFFEFLPFPSPALPSSGPLALFLLLPPPAKGCWTSLSDIWHLPAPRSSVNWSQEAGTFNFL